MHSGISPKFHCLDWDLAKNRAGKWDLYPHPPSGPSSEFVDGTLKCDHSNKSCCGAVVLFIILYKVVVLSFESVDGILIKSVNIKMKATEQAFPMVLFMLGCRK